MFTIFLSMGRRPIAISEENREVPPREAFYLKMRNFPPFIYLILRYCCT